MNERLSIEPVPYGVTGIALLRLSGTLDGHAGRTLMQRCAGPKAEGQSVVLILHDVTFISSSGIGVLLALTEDFRDRGLTLGLVRLSKEVRMAIGLLNLEHYLRIFDTEEEAAHRAAA